MKRRTQVFSSLARPRLFVLLPLTLLCAGALRLVFARGLDGSPAAYALYTASFYALAVWCLRAPGALRRIRARVRRNALAERCLVDVRFRARLSLLGSAAVNGLCALLKLGAGLYYRSFWFGALAVYYLALAAARGLLAKCALTGGRNVRLEYRAARLCGCLLFPLNAALLAVTLQMVLDGRGYRYPGHLIFAAALYAFYAVAAAIVGLVRFRRLQSPVYTAAKVLGLSTALVSMLSLQTAMFASFGGSPAFQRTMNALTGGAVCLTTLAMAFLMVARASRALRALSSNPHPEAKEN